MRQRATSIVADASFSMLLDVRPAVDFDGLDDLLAGPAWLSGLFFSAPLDIRVVRWLDYWHCACFTCSETHDGCLEQQDVLSG